MPGLALLVGVGIQTEDTLLKGCLKVFLDRVVSFGKLLCQDVQVELKEDSAFIGAPGIPGERQGELEGKPQSRPFSFYIRT